MDTSKNAGNLAWRNNKGKTTDFYQDSPGNSDVELAPHSLSRPQAEFREASAGALEEKRKGKELKSLVCMILSARRRSSTLNTYR